MGAGQNDPRVQLVYEAVDNASSKINNILKAEKRLQAATAGASSTAGAGILGALSNVVAFAGHLTLAVQGVQMLGSAMANVAKSGIALNASYEQTLRSISGNLKVFNLADSMEDAKKKGTEVYGILEKLAAPLPGETEDYLQVFRATLPQTLDAFSAAGERNLKKISEFTALYTAAQVDAGIDAAQAGRDLRQMLGGRAGMDVRGFSEGLGKLTIAYHQLGYQGELTTEVFNKLTKVERLKVLRQYVEVNRESLGAAANTSESMVGSFKSMVKVLARTASAPLFKLYIQTMQQVNGYLEKHLKSLLETATVWGGKAVNGILAAAAAMRRFGSEAARTYNWLRVGAERMLIMSGLGAQAKSAGSGAAAFFSQNRGTLGALGGAALSLGRGGSPVGAVAAGVVGGAIQTGTEHPEMVSAAAGSMGGAFNALLRQAAPLVDLFGSITKFAGGLVLAFAPLVEAVVAVQRVALAPFMAGFSLLSGLWKAMQPALDKIVVGFADLAAVVGPIVASLLNKFADALSWMMNVIGNDIGAKLQVIAGLFGTLMSEIAKLIGRFARWTGIMPSEQEDRQRQLMALSMEQFGAAAMSVAERIGGAHVDALKLIGNQAYNAMMPWVTAAQELFEWLMGPVAPKERQKVVYDFRGSKFDITQQFAEGFDADRIASAFASDLARLGEMRRQSGQAPLYSVR